MRFLHTGVMSDEFSESRTKILFNLNSDEWHGSATETLWAERIPTAADDAYRLLNTPFFMKGVSYLDIVRAKPALDDGFLEFDELISIGGHSTYRLLVPLDRENDFDQWWAKLEREGCSYESTTMQISLGPRRLYAVDVPARGDIRDVYAILEEGEAAGVWEFEEGHVGHNLDTTQ
jgi:hypothetical protein